MYRIMSRAKRLEGRKYFSFFEFINTLSFSFLAGNVLTLLMLRLGAGDALIGLLNSFVYLSFFFMPIGRSQVHKIGVVKNFSRSWLIRYLSMIPLIVVPYLFGDRPYIAIPLIFIGYLGFQVFRGIGIVSFNPILKELSTGPDQGSFLSRLQILVHLAGILANIALVLLVGPEAPLWAYGVSFAIGSALGALGAYALAKVPEPPGVQNASEKGILDTLKDAVRDSRVMRFLPAFALMIFFASMLRPFITVYAKQIQGLSDRVILILNLAGSLGAILMGLINRSMLDRMGAKPMIMIFTGVLQISVLVLLVATVFPSGAGLGLLILVFFLSTMGQAGGETSSQGYFLGIMSNKNQLELGIVYYVLMGISGALGSMLGGGVLDGFKLILGSNEGAFTAFFILVALGLLLTILTQLRLDKLKGSSVTEALSVLFSLRDWLAMSTLHHLQSSTSVDQEQRLLRRLRELRSEVSINEVVARLNSPLFRIRREALATLDYLPYNNRIQDALLEQVLKGDFATAYPAARILGQRGNKQAIPALEKALQSADPLLAGNAALALAELGDTSCREIVETRMLGSKDPSFIVFGAAALRLLGDTRSLPVLYTTAERNIENEFVVQEAASSIGGILGLEDKIHRIYPEFVKDREEGLVFLTEDLAGAQAEEIHSLLRAGRTAALISMPDRDGRIFAEEARRIASRPALFATPPFEFLFLALVVLELRELP